MFFVAWSAIIMKTDKKYHLSIGQFTA